jgi:hypothetical protein
LLSVVALAVIAITSTAFGAHAVPAAASDTPCSFVPALTCQSTDPTVTLNIDYAGNTSGCTFVWGVEWGDGDTSPNLVVSSPPDGYVRLAQHTYATPGTYGITVLAGVTDGSCTDNDFAVQFTLLPPSPAPTPIPTPPPSSPATSPAAPVATVYSTYAGYTEVAGGNGAFGLVRATWIVPGISALYCLAHPGSFPRVSPWVGLLGTDSSIRQRAAWLPQIGTISYCNNGFPGSHYVAFWEMETSVRNGGAKGYGSHEQTIRSMTIRPGDRVTGEVEFERTPGTDLTYKLQLVDSTRTKPGSPDGFSITVTTTGPVAPRDIMAQGGAVVEGDCSSGLVPFTSVPFTNVQVQRRGTPAPAGVNLAKWTMVGTDHATLAQAGPESGFPGMMKYTVTYKTNGLPVC